MNQQRREEFPLRPTFFVCLFVCFFLFVCFLFVWVCFVCFFLFVLFWLSSYNELGIYVVATLSAVWSVVGLVGLVSGCVTG